MPYTWGQGQAGGRVTSPQGVPQPSFADYSVLPLLTSMLEKKKQEATDIRTAFPALIAAKMAQVAKPGAKGTVPFGGQDWTIGAPGMDINKYYTRLRAGALESKLRGKPTEQGAISYAEDVMRNMQNNIFFGQSPEARAMRQEYLANPNTFYHKYHLKSKVAYWKSYGEESPYGTKPTVAPLPDNIAEFVRTARKDESKWSDQQIVNFLKSKGMNVSLSQVEEVE